MERTRIFSLLKFYVVLGLSVVIGYFLSTLLWNYISLPFSNPYLASGKLAQIEFNPVNNYIRFIIFVLMPVLVFALSLLIPSVKKLVLNVFSSLGKDTESSNANGVNQAKASFLSEKFLIITLSLLVLFPCLVFAQEGFTTSGFDIFHEGEQITPAFNYINGKGTWSGTLFVHGAFYDMFTAVLGWKLFGVNSIGAYRITVELLKILVPVGLALLLFAIWRSFKDKTKDTSSLLVQTILFFYLVSLRIQNFDRRDVPLLFGMFFLIMALNKRSRVLYFVAGLFSSISAFYSLDMGIYFTALVIQFVPVVALIKVYKPKDLATYSAYLFSGVIFGWVVFYSLVGHKEFLSFISNFGYFYKVKDLIDSYVYPFPSLLKSFRFTLPLILLSLNVLIYAVLFFFVYIKGKYKNEGVVHGLLTLISLIHYRSALGRSDLTHVEYSSSFLVMATGFNLALLITLLGVPKKIMNKASLSLAIVNITFLMYPVLSTFNPNNIIIFNRRVDRFIHEDKLSFVSSERISGVRDLQEIFSQESCIFSLTSESAMPYLLNKPSCGPIYISYFASAEPMRNNLLTDLKVYKPKYILYSSKSWTQSMDRINNEQRFPNVMNYVEANYSYFETVSDYWVVYKINQ